jgi:NADH-quinone oxidoreductase subunit C
METLEEIKTRVESAIPGAKITILANKAVPAQSSLILDHEHAVEIAKFLRDDPALQLDFCSNVTGVDWLDKVTKTKVKVKKVVDGEEKEVEETVEEKTPGYLESVYHLFSVRLKHGPVVIRLRTTSREVGDEAGTTVPSLTPVWKSAEFQEREAYDLYGIRYSGHPDLRRLLMWEDFQDHPMRKDYVGADDFEYEPTAHDKVLERAKLHYPKRVADGCDAAAETK